MPWWFFPNRKSVFAPLGEVRNEPVIVLASDGGIGKRWPDLVNLLDQRLQEWPETDWEDAATAGPVGLLSPWPFGWPTREPSGKQAFPFNTYRAAIRPDPASPRRLDGLLQVALLVLQVECDVGQFSSIASNVSRSSGVRLSWRARSVSRVTALLT